MEGEGDQGDVDDGRMDKKLTLAGLHSYSAVMKTESFTLGIWHELQGLLMSSCVMP